MTIHPISAPMTIVDGAPYLTIDPEFQSLIPTLTKEEYEKLVMNITGDGVVRDPLVVWGDVIVDGHHRWDILRKYPGIPFCIQQIDFDNRWDAIAWMCANQLGRRNVNPEQKTYLLGKYYEACKHEVGAPMNNQNAKKQCDQSDNIESPPGRVSEQIAKEQHVGRSTVIRAGQFARGLDAADSVSPGFKDKVLSREIRVNRADVADMRDMTEAEIADAVDAIAERASTNSKQVSPTADETTEDEAYDEIQRICMGSVHRAKQYMDAHLGLVKGNTFRLCSVLYDAAEELEALAYHYEYMW